jgi:cytoskeletal protein RodZ
MSLHCEQCEYENNEHYRFCGRCGAMLQAPVAAKQEQRTATHESAEPPASRRWHAPSTSAPPVTGPSFLGLSTEAPKNDASYLLEEDEPPANHKRMLTALLLLLAAVGVLAWHWRIDLLGLMGRLQKTNPEVSVAPVSTPSKTGGPALGSSAATGQAPSEMLAPTASNVTPRRSPPPLPAAGEANMVAPDAGSSPVEPAKKTAASPGKTAATTGLKTEATTKPAASPDTDSADNSDDSEAADVPPTTKPAATKPAATKASTPTPAETSGSADDRLVTEGQNYLYGDGVPENCDRAQKNFRTAAAHSNPHAMSLLGTMYATGHCVTLDLPTAYRWYARALHLDPSNDRIAQDLQILWRQMNADQRQAAIKNQ